MLILQAGDMNNKALSQYLACNQETVASTDSDQLLLKLKLYLNNFLDDLSMLYVNYTEGVESSLQLAAYLNDSNEVIASYNSTSQHEFTHPNSANIEGDDHPVSSGNQRLIPRNKDKLTSLYSDLTQNAATLTHLFTSEQFNHDVDLQANAVDCLESIIAKGSSVFCISACAPTIGDKFVENLPEKKIACLLICENNVNNKNYCAQNTELLMVLISLVFSNVARIEALKELQWENRRTQEELTKIATLQRQLLPADKGSIQGVEIAANFRACEQAGGDYYDFLSLAEMSESLSTPSDRDYWGAMIADSAGHGAAAAVEISMFDAILRTMTRENSTAQDGPAGVFNYTNQYLFTRVIRGTFITAFVIAYNPDLEMITYACAGHPPPILFKSSSQELIELDQSAGIPLAVVKDYVWENATISFRKNDILVMYTDGILEANNSKGEQFGLQRLKNLLIKSVSLSCQEMLSNIESAVDHFQQSKSRKDDQTLLILKRL
ncbi:Serine phosphatase RsbU, regulator of sigma subunit [hydrothermal vent metagenome]|uniref:Serine phosphatase RsbU, regulator of sigma subunit n=1 Tax=hydrothermal vent metagenome TaxID=652676 RepID=A0A3B0YF21_9ZZZZ